MAVDFTSIFQHTNYTIEQVIGEGGMAIVYLGEHKAMKRPVAIKFLLPEYVIIENIRKRFIAEGKNMFSMNHSNIVRVIDLIDQPDMVAIVMEYVPGNSLKVMIEKYGALEDDEIKEFFPQMLDAVAYVHAQNLIHRDIKPSNFMVSADGSVKLFDFGIAKNQQIENVEHTATGTNQTLGTPLYMSPEQVKETRNVSHHTDIYSLGVVLWQMVKGIRPYGSNTSSLFEIQTKIVNEPLERTGTVWDRIIQKATEKEPEKRYKDCASMLQDFKSVLDDQTNISFIGKNNFGVETIVNQASNSHDKKHKLLGVSISIGIIESKDYFSEEFKYGFIDTSGNWVIQPIFDYVGDFEDSEDITEAHIKEKVGFIDRQGNWVIQPIFDVVEDFDETGIARAVLNDKFGFINRQGNWVIQPVFDEVINGVYWKKIKWKKFTKRAVEYFTVYDSVKSYFTTEIPKELIQELSSFLNSSNIKTNIGITYTYFLTYTNSFWSGNKIMAILGNDQNYENATELFFYISDNKVKSIYSIPWNKVKEFKKYFKPSAKFIVFISILSRGMDIRSSDIDGNDTSEVFQIPIELAEPMKKLLIELSRFTIKSNES